MFSYTKLSLSISTLILACVPFLTYGQTKSLDDFVVAVTNVAAHPNPYTMFGNMCKNLEKVVTEDYNIIYDPRQSLFVTMFCNSLPDLQDNQTGKTLFYDDDKWISPYLKRQTLRDLGFICLPGQTANDGCIAASRASNNDYHYMMTKLMLEIQNERSNVALARLYGVSTIDESEREQINNMIARSYNAIGHQTVQKDYPKTVKKMEAYSRAGNKLLKKLQIIDLTMIEKEKSTLDTHQLCLLHALFFSQIDQKIPLNCISSKEANNRSYTHLLYNELFFYTLFSSTYAQYLDQFEFGKDSSDSNQRMPWLRDLVSRDALSIIRANIASQRNSIIQTTNQTSKALRDFESYFILHIGMLMYQEDLIDFRWRLARLYLPLHQLHYKIENVQKAKTT